MTSFMQRQTQLNPKRDFLLHFSLATGFIFMTSGVFLSGLAVGVGAGDVLIGYITAIPNICGVLILAFASLVERARNRKKLAIGLTVASRLVTLAVALVPLLPPGLFTLCVFVAVVVTAFSLQAQTTIVINNWLISFIGNEKRGRYISLRQTGATVATVILSLSMGWVVDGAASRYIGIAMVFGAALLVAVGEVLLLMRIPGAAMAEAPKQAYRLVDSIKTPLKNKPFRLFVLYVSLFFFFLYVSDSFTILYMMQYLKLPYATITGLQMLIPLPQIVLLGLWGRLADKYGHRFALAASIWFFIGEGLLVALSGAGNYMFTLAGAFLFAAAGNAGFLVAVLNRRFELMPPGGRILHDNFYSASIGIAFIAGPAVGGLVKDAIAASPLAGLLPFIEIRGLYVISVLGLLLLQLGYLLHQSREKRRRRAPGHGKETANA